MMKNWCITLSLLLLSSMAVGQSFSSFVSKRQVPMGEVFQVTFELKDGQGVNLQYPSFDNFQVRGGPSIQQSVQMVNGQVSRSFSYTFYLQGTKKGTFTIGPASIEVGDKTLRSQPIEVSIVDARSNPGRQGNAQGNGGQQAQSQDIESQLKDAVFVRAFVSDREVFQGEQLTVSYKLYERVQTYELRPEENPSYEGFWVENIDIRNPSPLMDVIDGKQYRTYVVKKDILLPQRPGELVIDPLKLSATVRVQTAPRRRRSVFDSFFGQYQNYQYQFASATVRIKVKPLPGNRPGDFSGLVGKLSLQATLDTTQVETGAPLTLRVKLSGQGNIKKIQAPELNLPPDFDVYDPNVSESISRNGGVLGGRRTYEYLIVPRNPGQFELPPITYSYFDIEAGRYRSLSSPSFTVQVTGEAQQPSMASKSGSGIVEQSDVVLLSEDIRYIHPASEALQAQGTYALYSWSYWLLYLMPILAIVGLWLVKRRSIQDRQDAAGARRRRAGKVARKRLSVAQQHLQAGSERAFYDEVARAVWDYLGHKFNIGQSEHSRARATELLQEWGAEESLTQRLTQLLDTCEMALFAPSAAPGGMAGTYEQAAELITDLEALQADRSQPISPKALSLILVAMLITPFLGAQEEMSSFEVANRAYADRQYETAITSYQALLDSNLVSADLYYNLGNAHYQAGHLGQAILHYERALRLDPAHRDAAFNLSLANRKVVDNVQPLPEFVLTRWGQELVDSRSADQWAYWGLALLWLVVGMVALLFFVPRPQIRRVAFVGGILLGLASVTCLGLSLAHQQRMLSEQEGLIITPNAYVKNAPGGNTDLLILHEGIKVEILDQVDEWMQIRLEGANLGEVIGFVPRDRIAVI